MLYTARRIIISKIFIYGTNDKNSVCGYPLAVGAIAGAAVGFSYGKVQGEDIGEGKDMPKEEARALRKKKRECKRS